VDTVKWPCTANFFSTSARTTETRREDYKAKRVQHANTTTTLRGGKEVV
jgi:hypothetical protein